MPAIASSASAKTILFGEHAVVYGHPAIAIPVTTLRVKAIIQPSILSNEPLLRQKNIDETVENSVRSLDENNIFNGIITEFEKYIGQPLPPYILTIASNVPVAAGLGSSASAAIAVIRALSRFIGKKLSEEDINSIAFLSEQIQHGSPSGIDNSVIAFEKPVFFKKGQPIEFLKIKNDFHFVLADSSERTPTKDVIQRVTDALEKRPSQVNAILTSIGNLSSEAKNTLLTGDATALGRQMTENHMLLNNLGVSTDQMDLLVNQAIHANAYGAKLCGGGRGGFIVAICSADSQTKIARHLENYSPHVIPFTLAKDD